MIPLRHPESNARFGAPTGMEGQVGTLWVCVTDQAVVSRWEPTPDELLALMLGGSVELAVMGRGMPPVSLSVVPRQADEAAHVGSLQP